MSRCLRHFATAIQKRIVVLVATSGDTGGAVAHGFYDAEGVDVVILYPKGKVSAVQEQQLTALGKNITALEVEGSFDDCQRMVKAAFADAELTDALQLTSANSINIARWLPQQLYYALAWKQWPYKNEPPVVCVPSGNFGNLCAAMLLQASGLPVQKFIAACNANDTIPRFLQDGELAPHDTVATLSNAMDVARPSNWVRIMELAGNDPQRLHALLEACRVDDAQTLAAMRQLYEQYNYTCDPHTAVACEALTQYQQRAGGKGYIVSTAHAVKFADVVEAATQQKIGMPESVKALMAQPSAKLAMGTGYGELKRYLKEKFGV
jgi:threonine synthase